MDLGLGYGTDYYGYRKKFAVLVPSTNTAVEYEYNRMAPAGVVVATRGCVIPPFHVQTEDDFVAMVKAIGAATEQGLRDSLTLKPDHVIFGYSAETFWDGKERSDREFARYNAIAQEVAGLQHHLRRPGDPGRARLLPRRPPHRRGVAVHADRQHAWSRSS